MLHDLQAKYAGKPVTFLLFPCNEFMFQEPHANSVIKTFAEKYVNLTSSMMLFAKSDVNKDCEDSSADTCMPSSSKCCSRNNGIYEFLRMKSGKKCSWNFNKFFITKDGEFSAGPLGDNAYADKVVPYIDELLK